MKKIIGLICILLVLGFVFQKNDDSYDTLWSLIADAEEIGNKDITEILTNQEDIDINTIDDLYIYICEHSDYGYDFSRCSEAEKKLFFTL